MYFNAVKSNPYYTCKYVHVKQTFLFFALVFFFILFFFLDNCGQDPRYYLLIKIMHKGYALMAYIDGIILSSYPLVHEIQT